MRLLFNHGLSAAELFTNTPKKIIDRKWRWFIANYGSTSSYSDAISDPFKYCMFVVMNKVINDKVRFIIPGVADAYIDFEVVADDNFYRDRDNGRFQEIDFIASDFTGYAIRYYYKAKAYQKSYPIHVGGDLKKNFLGRINTGEKFYSIKDITILDILPIINERFPELTKVEISKLIRHGFRRMHSSIKFGCAITINTTKFGNCYLFIGSITTDPAKQIKTFHRRRNRKLRKIAEWAKEPFDGHYYIALNSTAFKEWMITNNKVTSVVKFNNVIPRKLLPEWTYKYKQAHIFRVTLKKFKGWAFWADELISRDTEYMGEMIERKFISSTQTWKELRNEARSN